MSTRPGVVRGKRGRWEGRPIHTFEYEGRTLTIAEAAALAGIEYPVLYQRLVVLHWPVERAMQTPLKPAATVVSAKRRHYDRYRMG